MCTAMSDCICHAFLIWFVILLWHSCCIIIIAWLFRPSIVQWVQHPTKCMEGQTMGVIPVRGLMFFFVPRLWQDKHYIFLTSLNTVFKKNYHKILLYLSPQVQQYITVLWHLIFYLFCHRTKLCFSGPEVKSQTWNFSIV